MPTIADIAEACGTSKATVSKVLNGNDHKISAAKREEIKLTVSRMRYQPSAHAKSLSNRRANMIGVVTCQVTGLFTSQYYTTLLNSILDEATAQKQTMALFNGQFWADEDEQQLIFADGRCDGLLVIGAPSIPGLVPALLRTPMPFVTINSGTPGGTLPFVAINSGPLPAKVNAIDIDNVEAGRKATRYFIDRGHRKIAFFHAFDESPSSQGRLQGYRLALAEAGLPFEPGFVYIGEGFFEPTYQRALGLAAHNPMGITAVFCASDAVALATMHALKDSGYRIPEDFSVIGVDDTPASAQFQPGLTTVSQSLDKLGAEATRLLLSLIASPNQPPQKIVWPTELKIRNSVAPVSP